MPSDQDLYQLLLELKTIEKTKLDTALLSSQTNKIPLEETLLREDLITDENLGKAMADLFDVQFINLGSVSIPHDILTIVPEIVARKQKIISFKKDAEGLHLALNNPTDTQICEFISKKTGLPIVRYYATKQKLEDAFRYYAKNITQAFADIISENIKLTGKNKDVEAPIIKIVDTILEYADSNKASDIHIEPQEENSLIRFRIDSILHDVLTLPLDVHAKIVTRIKVLSRLRTDEHQAAQDGKFQFGKEKIDVRVSIIPIVLGEKIVMRLLSEKSRQFSLTDLGTEQSDLNKIISAYEKPYGMILATGPTGSGKTTTMYAIIKLLNQRSVNIMTIEDPVEYEIFGINQIQVNPKTNLTFAAGLKSILRQDPNIILVGEVRDSETAGIAVNAAMTGHLVLSTLHTNDAPTAIPRLIDMGIEPFLIASSVNVIIAQRLVRKICVPCKMSVEKKITEMTDHLPKDLVAKHFGEKETVRVYQGKGCPVCHNTGYSGRIGIFEVLLVSEKIKEAIASKKTAAEIKKIAISEGMRTMIEDGILKIKSGETTVDEILRVTKE
jgi:type IV pilus assembly protein PilB